MNRKLRGFATRRQKYRDFEVVIRYHIPADEEDPSTVTYEKKWWKQHAETGLKVKKITVEAIDES